jgi:hypothetical protein
VLAAVVVLQIWLHNKATIDMKESQADILTGLHEGLFVTTSKRDTELADLVKDHGDRTVKIVMEFTARLTALEELALIESQERRSYLKMAEVKVQEKQAAMARAKAEGKPVIPPGFNDPSEEVEPDPTDKMLAMGTRRGHYREPPPVKKDDEKKEEASA